MAVISIPVRNDVLNYKFKIDLDGDLFTLRFKFNERQQTWHMDIMTGDTEEPIISGRPLITDLNVFGRFKDARLPKGTFLMTALADDGSDPGRDSLGDTHQLLYEEASA